MKNLFAVVLALCSVALSHGQVCPNTPVQVTGAGSISIQSPIDAGTGNGTVYLYSAAMLQPKYMAYAYDDLQSYPLLALSPANQIGSGAAFLLKGAVSDGSPITVSWGYYDGNGNWIEASPLLVTLVACQLPSIAELRGPVLNRQDSSNTIYSARLGLSGLIGIPIKTVFSAQAGDSNLPPYTAGPGCTLPPNSFTQNSAVEFCDFTLPQGNYASMSWAGWAFHASGIYFAIVPDLENCGVGFVRHGSRCLFKRSKQARNFGR